MREKTYWGIGIGLGGGIAACGLLGLIVGGTLFINVGIGLLVPAGLFLIGHKFVVKVESRGK